MHGTGGKVFGITDDLSDSLMSVNSIAGLPIFEVFANNTIIAGQYNSGDFTITGNNIGVGNKTPIYKFDVSGSGRFSSDLLVNSIIIGKGVGNIITNTVVGNGALNSNTTGDANSAFGYKALNTNTTGFNNSAFGYKALSSNTTGRANSAFGFKALSSNSLAGKDNTAVGASALRDNVTGISNTALGSDALLLNKVDYQTSIGWATLTAVTTGGSNTAVGSGAGLGITTGSQNTIIGTFAAGLTTILTTGSNNTVLGYGALTATATSANSVTLGNSSIATLRCQVTTITALSDFRDKTEINNVQIGLSFIEKLRPVTFKWDKREWYNDGNRDGSKKEDTLRIGFIAQELKELQESENATYLNLVLEDNPDKLEATPGNLMTPLIKAVQELSAEVKTLKAKVQALESK